MSLNASETKDIGEDYRFINLLSSRQYGDVFLFKIVCPLCNKEDLQPFPFNECNNCQEDLGFFSAEISKNFKYKCVVGTKRRKRIKAALIKNLAQLQNNRCAYCDSDLGDFELEHIKPLACGGTNDFSNLCLSCKTCNQIAGSFYFDSFYSKKLYILKKRNNSMKYTLEDVV